MSECSSNNSSRGPASPHSNYEQKHSPHGPDSGYMGSPSHHGSDSLGQLIGSPGSPSSTPSPRQVDNDQVLDLTNIKKRSPDTNDLDANSYRKHKMKMHKSSSSSCSSSTGSRSPEHRRTPSPLVASPREYTNLEPTGHLP